MNDTKPLTLCVRMSVAEHKRLQKLARMHNQSMAAWVRDQVAFAKIEGRPARMVMADDE